MFPQWISQEGGHSLKISSDGQSSANHKAFRHLSRLLPFEKSLTTPLSWNAFLIIVFDEIGRTDALLLRACDWLSAHRPLD